MQLTSSSDRRIGMLGMLLCVFCLAYFYVLDYVILSSASFTQIFQTLLVDYDTKTAWLSAGVCLFAALWSRPAPILRLVDLLGRNPRVVSLVGMMAFALGAVFIYQNYPLCMDEYAAVFQSKVFASGQVFAQLPASVVNWLVVPGFNGSFLVASPDTGRAIEGYWPGYALLLAPFQFLGVPWLCNATLAGLAIFLVHQITFHITGNRRAAGWAALFTVGSSAFWANAISYYSMQAHLTANLLFAWLLLRPGRTRSLAAGLVGSLALVLHNPFPHVLFAAPWLMATAVNRDTRRYLLPLLLGYLPGLALGVGWLLLRADIGQAAQDPSAISGMVSVVFEWPGAVLLNMRAASIVKMWVWALPCLFAFALLGRLRYRDNRHVRLLTQSAALTFVGYFFVKLDQGHGWGYRYFHSAWGVIPVLAACAMGGNQEEDPRLVSFAGAAAILSLLIIVPFQMSQIEGIITRHIALIPKPKRPGNNVYFIQPGGGLYIADAIQLDPLLRSQDLLLASRGSDLNAELVRQNWPDAVKSGGVPWVEQWYLGPIDQRVSIPATRHQKRFVLHFRHASQPPDAR